MEINFNGPIFIIGMPRSGTKLLRELLNGHSKIQIPSGETEFLPYWVANWCSYGDLSNFQTFSKFYELSLTLPYFIYTREQNALIDCQQWYNSCQNFSLAGVFKALMRHDAGIRYKSSKIWGDKSPSYINHVALLKSIYPQARFIHIIRDARDYCLSMQKAWGKHPIRAAQRWVEGLEKADRDTAKFKDDYLEICYEDILSCPEAILSKCCNLLEIDFERDMLQLPESTENIGSAKGYNFVKQDNKKKYIQQMKPKLQQRIEKIAGQKLSNCGYEVEFVGPPERVSTLEMNLYKVIDGYNLVQSEFAKRGFYESVYINWKRFNISGNRH